MFPVAGLVVLLLAGMSPAEGAEALYLTWTDCASAATASHDLTWACDSNVGHSDLFCAFRTAVPVDSVLGFEIAVDVQHADEVLPDWWRFASGGCRYGGLTADFDFSAYTECVDFSRGRAAGGVLGYYVGEPRGEDSQARIRLAASWLPGAGYVSLDPDSTYFAVRLVFSHALTGGCAGCARPACLVFNGMMIRRQPGAAGGDVELSVPGNETSNWATWQGGAGAACAAVPVRCVTWGRLKGLYR